MKRRRDRGTCDDGARARFNVGSAERKEYTRDLVKGQGDERQHSWLGLSSSGQRSRVRAEKKGGKTLTDSDSVRDNTHLCRHLFAKYSNTRACVVPTSLCGETVCILKYTHFRWTINDQSFCYLDPRI